MEKKKRTYTAEQKARRSATSAAYYQKNKHKIDPIAALERQRAWKKANPEKVREYQLRHQPKAAAKKYGLTPETVRAIIAAQKGLCGICSSELVPWPNVRTHVDHDHKTGQVRGVLCSACNRYEGWMRRYADKLKTYLDNPPAKRILDLA